MHIPFQSLKFQRDTMIHLIISIISHAITKNLTLISSDRKSKDYELRGLKFVFKKR